MLYKIFPIKLKPGQQAAGEAIVTAYAPEGPAKEPGTHSFRVYRDPENVDYLLFVEHFEDQAAYEAHTGSPAYATFIADQLTGVVEDFVELDHELIVAL